MTSRRTKAWLLACSVTFVHFSCVGTDVGNPPDDDRIVIGSLEFAVYESGATGGESVAANASSARQLTVSGSIEIESVWFTVGRLWVTPVDDCRPESARAIEGPFYVDLLGGEVYPSPPVLTERAESYCALRLDLVAAKEIPDEAPPELLGQSLWLRGATAAGTDISLGMQAQRRLDYAGQAFEVSGDAGQTVRFIAAFEPSEWFSDVDVTVSTPVEIDEVGRAADLAAFWAAFAWQSRILLDEDDDGTISAAEFDRPVAVPSGPPE